MTVVHHAPFEVVVHHAPSGEVLEADRHLEVPEAGHHLEVPEAGHHDPSWAVLLVPEVVHLAQTSSEAAHQENQTSLEGARRGRRTWGARREEVHHAPSWAAAARPWALAVRQRGPLARMSRVLRMRLRLEASSWRPRCHPCRGRAQPNPLEHPPMELSAFHDPQLFLFPGHRDPQFLLEAWEPGAPQQ